MLRLLDADSQESDFYGDLLVVTFEVEIEEGEPRARDDAAEVGWFPIATAPPLAFPSNERALIHCRRLYGETWAIQDSFAELQDGGAFLGARQGLPPAVRQGLGQALLSDALVTLVREQAPRIAGLWLQEVRTSATTSSYTAMRPEDLLGRACTALTQFGRWLQSDPAGDEIRDFYLAVGRERRAAGVPLHQVLSSLSLLRKHVWTFARGQGIWRCPIDAYRVLELDRRILRRVRSVEGPTHGAAGGFPERVCLDAPPPARRIMEGPPLPAGAPAPPRPAEGAHVVPCAVRVVVAGQRVARVDAG
ncbi:MAG: hypothetical protein ABIO70_00910 [Pseudomonadota bacterium]